jgi:hypothetical protein
MDVSLVGLVKHLSKRLKPVQPKPVKSVKKSVHFSLSNESMPVNSEPSEQEKADALLGFGVSIIIVVFLSVLILWGFALYLVSKNWDQLLPWAKVVSLIGLFPIFPYGPLITIIAVLVGRNKK